MSDIFRFKQFSVDQSGCAMKVNTDGVLLGAIASASNPKRILDIGAGTGVIALMLAQRFPDAQVDAIEIDAEAAAAARQNFKASSFNNRLHLLPGHFKEVLALREGHKYDLMVSNPPFYIHSLHSPGAQKAMAKHADAAFLSSLLYAVAGHLTQDGLCWLIMPLNTAELVKELAKLSGLHIHQIIHIKSFPDAAPHREMLAFRKSESPLHKSDFIIYKGIKIYSEEYQELLKDFLIIF